MTTTTTAHASSNELQAKDRWSADKYNEVASFVYSDKFTAPVFGLLNAQKGERILDFGCGSGDLSNQIRKAVGEDGFVLGVDSSSSMVEKAKKNGFSASFVADIQDLHLSTTTSVDSIKEHIPSGFDFKFDAVFTNATLHWCKRSPQGVADSAARALKKGGRFVGEFGGFTNTIGLRIAIYSVFKRRGLDPVVCDPFYYPSTEAYQKVLENAGFTVEHISLNPRYTPLKTDLIDFQETFCRNSFYANLSDEEAKEVMQEVQDVCAIDCRDEAGNWALMYTRLRFVAILK